ncbi:MAG: NAD(P)H-binding protein [Balneolales bacterium]|nr:NAD(P)H-binding protein [Balneolales bacterium]
MEKNYLVIGGTGKTGRRVVEKLQGKGHNVKVASRNSSPSFNWDDPETYKPALEGIDRVYIVYYPDLAVPGAYEAISMLTEAAKNTGVEKLVLLSGKGEKEAERCEQVVANSGLDYTLVRASWFNQNFSESFFLEPVQAGIVATPMPDAEIPFVDADDIAEVAVQALINDDLNGQTVAVTGPELYKMSEVVEIIAEASNRSIQYVPVTLDQYTAEMRSAGLPDSYIWLFEYLFKEVLTNPSNQEISTDVERVLGRKPKSFKQFAQETAKTGIWSVKEKTGS